MNPDKELQQLVGADIVNVSEKDLLAHKASLIRDIYKQGLNYPSWTPERGKWWYKSIIYFVNEFIKPELPIPEFHKDWYWWRVSEQSYMNLAPRDHAKTTVHDINSVVWEICVNRNITFFMVFAKIDTGKTVLSQIKSQLIQNSRIRDGFGIFNPAELEAGERSVDLDWSKTSITVERDDFSIKDPTVVVTGAGTSVLSRRAHRLILDDIIDDKIAYSDAESDRVYRWVMNDCYPVLVSDGQDIITGTRYKKGDFYSKIEEMSKEKGGNYQVYVGDAIIDESTKEVLWKDRWPYEALMRRRRTLGSIRFNRNYRNRVLSDEDSPFPMVWFEGGMDSRGYVYKGCYDNSLILGQGPKDKAGQRWLQFISIGTDPALSKVTRSKSGKFFACVVLGIDFMGKLVLLDLVRTKINFVGQKRIIATLNGIWKPRWITVESNAYQQALTQGLDEMNSNMPVYAFYSANQGERRPEIGVQAMDIYFEKGGVRIPRGDQKSIELTDLLIEELHYWGSAATSDVAMAFWFAFYRLKPQLDRLMAVNRAPGDMVFGDRVRHEMKLIRGISGKAIPNIAHTRILSSIMSGRAGPYANISPLSAANSIRKKKKFFEQKEIPD